MQSVDQGTAQAQAAPPTAKVIALARRAPSRRDEREFLPAALEIIETPASPLGRGIAATLILFFLIAIAWACLGQVDIVAVAQGKIVPTGRIKTIQPLEAGIVSAIRVKDGNRVAQGDVLVELDRTVSTAERNRVRHELTRVRLDVARLVALRAGLDGDLAPGSFAPPADAPAYEVERTRAAMLAQAEQQRAKLRALDQQVAQKHAEAEENAATIAKLQAALPLLEETNEVRRKAMQIQYGNRIAYLDAQLKLTDQRNELTVQQRRTPEIAAARQALEAQRAESQAEYAGGIMNDLAEAEQKAAQLAEDLVKAEKKMQDQVLRAPLDGTVQQLAIHTIGGVVTPAQALMVMVPADSRIEIEAMIQNKDIGFVEEGNEVEIKIDTFNFTKYGLLHGKVLTVSADSITREKPQGQQSADRSGTTDSGARSSEPDGQQLVYSARVSLDATRMLIERKWVDLVPGMAVTAEIKTGSRRIIEYVLSPILRYRHETLRER
jgi:hemolysin D